MVLSKSPLCLYPLLSAGSPVLSRKSGKSPDMIEKLLTGKLTIETKLTKQTKAPIQANACIFSSGWYQCSPWTYGRR